MIKPEIKEIKFSFNCSEDWSKMEVNGAGRNCTNCNNTVFDFSHLTNQEIIKFLKYRKNQKTCARISELQLESINSVLNCNNSPVLPGPYLAAALLSTLIACSPAKKVTTAQCLTGSSRVEILSDNVNPDNSVTTLIKGKIVDRNGEPLINAKLQVNEINRGVFSDLDGNFEMEIPNSDISDKMTNCLTSSFYGYEKCQIPLNEVKNKAIKIVLEEDPALMGEIMIIEKPLNKSIWSAIKKAFRKN